MEAFESPDSKTANNSRPWQHALDAERALMNDYAPDYRRSMLFSSYYYQEERRRFVEWILDRLARSGRDPRGLSYLDVGSGTGEIVELLAQHGCSRLTGFDVAEGMQRESAKRRIPGLRLVRGTVETHPFGEGTFDVVTAALTVHHLYDPRAFFALVDRVLRPGGSFFVLDYNATSWTHSRWTGLPIQLLCAPLRRLIKLKNRKPLGEKPSLPARFNPAHRLLSYDDFVLAMPDAAGYRISRHTRGLFLPAFKYALIAESPFDRVLHGLLRATDSIAKPFGRGSMMTVAGVQRGPR